MMIEKSIVPFYYFSPRCCVLSAEALFLAALPPHPFRRVSFIQSRDSGSQFRASTLKKRVNWEHNRIASTKYSKLVSLNSSLCYYDINISSQKYKIMIQTRLKSRRPLLLPLLQGDMFMWTLSIEIFSL